MVLTKPRLLARGSVVVVGVLVLGVVLSGCTGAPRSLGSLRWSDAIAASSHSRTLTVSADVDRAWASAGCATFTEKVTTRETSTSIAVKVVGYAAALPPGTACDAARVTATRVTVQLKAPIEGRALVDSTTGDVHSFLDLATAPALHRVPAHFTEQVGYWSERTGVAYRWWRSRSDAQINLYSGPRDAVASEVQKLPAGGTVVEVRGASAVVHRVPFGSGWDTRVDWTVAGGRAIELEVLDQSTSPLATSQVVELARSTY